MLQSPFPVIRWEDLPVNPSAAHKKEVMIMGERLLRATTLRPRPLMAQAFTACAFKVQHFQRRSFW